jgi:hypothetical protein
MYREALTEKQGAKERDKGRHGQGVLAFGIFF